MNENAKGNDTAAHSVTSLTDPVCTTTRESSWAW